MKGKLIIEERKISKGVGKNKGGRKKNGRGEGGTGRKREFAETECVTD